MGIRGFGTARRQSRNSQRSIGSRAAVLKTRARIERRHGGVKRKCRALMELFPVGDVMLHAPIFQSGFYMENFSKLGQVEATCGYSSGELAVRSPSPDAAWLVTGGN